MERSLWRVKLKAKGIPMPRALKEQRHLRHIFIPRERCKVDADRLGVDGGMLEWQRTRPEAGVPTDDSHDEDPGKLAERPGPKSGRSERFLAFRPDLFTVQIRADEPAKYREAGVRAYRLEFNGR